MDPNAILQELRERIAKAKELEQRMLVVFGTDSVNTQMQLRSEYAQIADLFHILDGWLTGGGFLPDDWRSA